MKTLRESLMLPFRGAVLIANVGFALLLGAALWGMLQVGPFAVAMIPALVILGPWFGKYCLLVLRQAAYGRDEAPTLGAGDLSPFELRPVVLVGILVGFATTVGEQAGTAAGILATALIAPPAAAIGAIEERTVSMFHPGDMLRYVVGLGGLYPLVVLGWLVAGAVAVVAIDAGIGVIPGMFVVQSILLATCHGTGRLLHAQADAVGYDRPDTARERQDRAKAAVDTAALEDQLQQWYELVDMGQVERAYDQVKTYLRDQGEPAHLYETIVERCLTWPDPTLGLAVARDYAARLLARGRSGEALRVFLRVYDMEASVRPPGEQATLSVARLAREAGRCDVAEALLGDFEQRYPETTSLPMALAMQASLLCAQERVSDARTTMARLEQEFPHALEHEPIQKLRSQIDRLASAPSDQ